MFLHTILDMPMLGTRILIPNWSVYKALVLGLLVFLWHYAIPCSIAKFSLHWATLPAFTE